MSKVSNTIVNKALRDTIFSTLFDLPIGSSIDSVKIDGYTFRRINDRQWGTIITDQNGVHRYNRIGVIVAEEREDKTAEELMQSEIDEYNFKQAEKAEKAKAKAEKIAKDKARREKEKEEKENE